VVGLGRMGANIARRLMRDGHICVVFDLDPDEGVPAPVLTTALYSRFASRGLDDFAGKALSAMRKGFGGHDEKKQ